MKYFLAFFVGALSVASYAPLEWWWLMPACLVVLFQLIQQSSGFETFKLMFLYALGQFGFGASWIYVSLQTYGNMPVWMAAIAVFLFVAVCALVTGLLGYVYSHLRLTSKPLINATIFAAIWVIAEWLRSVLFTGFPWLDVGYSQTTHLLSAYAPLGSVYLVSFVTVLASASALVMLQEIFKRPDKQLKIRIKKAVAPVFMLLSICVGGIVLSGIQWSQASGRQYSVVIVQANVLIEEKWQRQFQADILANYFEQIQQYQADLVILPETALPVSLHQTDEDFWTQLRGKNKAVLSGVVERDLSSGEIYNSANLVCADYKKRPIAEKAAFYEGEQVYRKQHLVPFGEYLPLRALLNWILSYLQIPMSDFSSGDAGQILECAGLQIGLSICYEDAFAAQSRRSLPLNSSNGVLVNISEDAWFGDSLAPHQRVQIAQMRALELSRPMLRSANSGPSTHISFKGEILKSTNQFVPDSILVQVQPRSGDTPFARFGLWIIVLCFVAVFMRLGLLMKLKISS